MKKLTIYSILLIILAIFVITGLVVAQSDDIDPPCGRLLIEGRIGEFGALYLKSYSESYIVPANGAYCFQTTGNSLCPNTGAEVIVYLNGIIKLKENLINDPFNGIFAQDVFFSFVAQKDDIITIEANLFQTDIIIICIWPGRLDFKLAGYCICDLNNDGEVDGSDLAIFVADFGRIDCQNDPPCEGDLDADGDVDGSDLSLFASSFGSTSCP